MPKNMNNKGRAIKGRFLALPLDVLRSPAWRSLSFSASKLLVDVAAQYNGRNNGDLVACMSILGRCGWSSNRTLHKAKSELLRAGLIEQTRQGGMSMGPSLFAITWQAIDDCEDRKGNRRHDVKPTRVASGLWKAKKAAV